MTDINAIIATDKMIVRLRTADAQMAYTPELLRKCLASVVQASSGIALPKARIAAGQDLAEVAYFAGLRDYPLDLLAEEFKKHLIHDQKSQRAQLRVHQMAGLLTIRLSTALTVLGS